MSNQFKNFVFFEETAFTLANIAQLFDYIWPITTALNYIRREGALLLAAQPELSPKAVNDHFFQGRRVQGANMKGFITNCSADDQRRFLAKMVLFETISLYEGWLLTLIKRLDVALDWRHFQVPGRVERALADYRAAGGVSACIEHCYYPLLAAKTEVAPSYLRARIGCFRAFKQVRNALAHNNGVIDDKQHSLLRNYQNVQATDLFTPEELQKKSKTAPRFGTLTANRKIELDLHGVVGFTEILQKIMVTIDAEMARGGAADRYLLARFRANRHPRLGARRIGVSWLNAASRRIGLAAPEQPARLFAFLQQGGLIAADAVWAGSMSGG